MITAVFKDKKYQVIITTHARDRMALRGLSEEEIIYVLENGSIKNKDIAQKFWVYKRLRKRHDNFVALSVSIEDPKLIVVTALVNWRPK